MYKRSEDTFTKLTGIEALAGLGYGVSFSSDDTYLAVAHESSPRLTVYKRIGDTFNKLTDKIDVSPTGSGHGVSFSSDDTYLAVAHDYSPYLTVYKTTLIATTLISPALNTIPLEYDDLGYALASGNEEDEIEMVSIFSGSGNLQPAETVVELTQAQYDALSVYDNNTYYLIVEE